MKDDASRSVANVLATPPPLLLENTDFWRIVLGSIGDGIILTDKNGLIDFINPKAENLCNVLSKDVIGKPIVDVFQIKFEDTNLTAENPIEAVFSTKAPFSGTEFLLVSKNRSASKIYIEFIASPIFDVKKELQGVILTFRDMSLKHHADELNQRLAAVVESSDDIILSKDLNGNITSWNKGAERVLGYTEAEVIGKNVSMLMPQESIEEEKNILIRIRKGERVDHYETKRRTKHGRIVDVSLTVSPIRNSLGVIVGASKVGRDITEKRRSAELRERLAAIVESSDDMIVSKDLTGKIMSWNRGAEQILGYSAEEMIGKNVSMLMPPEHPEDFQKILAQISEGKTVSHYETKRRRKDGTIVDLSLTVSPIRDSSGRIIGASKIARDISKYKQLEAERQLADRRKDEFLAMLGHELRNPLAAINSAVQLYGRLKSKEDLDWARLAMQKQIKHLARLIDDLLDVSRITRGKISLRKEVLDISPIVATAVETVRPLIEERKHELNVSLAPGSLKVNADPVRLEQILVNLLTNAAKYTDSGGRVSLSVYRENKEILFKVKDNGIGIAPELLPNVFDMFVQGDRSSARTEGGLGIGLTLVNKLVEIHGGNVVALSNGLGQGSEFIVRLPAATANVAQQNTKEQSSEQRKGSKILIVEDNPDTATGLSKLLKLLGHEVMVASDGIQAIEIAQHYKPEVILLDIGLPGMDGYQVGAAIRADECCKNSLIIGISGYGQAEDIRRGKQAGFDHHLMKPLDYDALMTILNTN